MADKGFTTTVQQMYLYTAFGITIAVMYLINVLIALQQKLGEL